MWSLVKNTGNAIHKGLPVNIWEWPNTVTFAIALRQKYDSFLELPEVPPEEHWDFPDLITRHIEKIYPHMKKSSAEYDSSAVES